jgi:fucose permease
MVSNILLIIIYLSFISLGLPDSLLGSAWPSMYSGLAVPLHYAGYVAMIVAAGTVVSSFFSARVIARLGTGLVTVLSVSLTAAALFGFSLSGSFLPFCLWAIPLGLGAGSVDAALNNYVALHYKSKHMSWLHCFWGIGASAGPLIMSFYLINNNTWNQGYRTIGIMQTALVIILLATLSIWGKNETSAGQKNTVHKHVPFNELLRIPGVKQVLVSFFSYCTIEITAGLWGSSFLVEVKGIPAEIAARWISLFYIGITSGRFISGFLAGRLTNRQMVRLGQGLILSGVIFVMLPFGSLFLLPGFFMIGLGCAPIFPSLLHETPKNFGSERSQTIMGVQMASAYVGTALMPSVFGQIASFASFGIFPFFLSFALAINIFMTESLNKKVK